MSRRKFYVLLSSVLSFAVVIVLVGSGCKKGPNWSLLQDDPSGDLIAEPAYSPMDTSIYYVDSGADSASFEAFKRGETTGYWPVIQPGIYRLKLFGDDPAELVAANGVKPEITHDGATLYYIDGLYGGAIWRKTLPDGDLELVMDGDFVMVRSYSPDTLLVERFARGMYFLDLVVDSLTSVGFTGGQPDVAPDKKICFVRDSLIGIYDSAGIEWLRPMGAKTIRNCHWSPNSREIVFWVYTREGQHQVRIIDLEENERVPPIDRGFDADFSSDGQYLIYVQYASQMTPWGASVRDGQLWIAKEEDGSGKRQVSTWSRIRP